MTAFLNSPFLIFSSAEAVEKTRYRNGNSRKGYWAIAGSGILKTTITNERLVQAGYYSILDRYESMHLCYPTNLYRTVRTVV